MEPTFIKKEREIRQSEDFTSLRALGIKYVQELTGAFWTDYNEHDPGVTILEQLCYALTDLAYKTNFDIEHHLFNSDDNDQAFFKPQDILPCNALTIKDYRKVILDSFFEVKNVWFDKIDLSTNSINGLYRIYLNLDDSIKTEEEKEAVVAKVVKFYNGIRNLSEDVEDVVVLSKKEVKIFGDVEVDGIREIESVYADIYYYIQQYLSTEVQFYSLQEMIDEGKDLQEIFNGPLLKHGFIKDEDLHPRVSKLLISEIIKIIMQLEGVISVKNLYLQIGDKRFDNQIELADDELPSLSMKISSSENTRNIEFFKGDVHYGGVDNQAVLRKLNEMLSSNTRVYRLNEEYFDIEKGEELSIEYNSIQEHFPAVYGVGEDGIPGGPDKKRIAQAKQLKAYLVIFEQLMVNYLAQLSHSKELFSLKTELNQTYFFDLVRGKISNVDPLLADDNESFIEDKLLFEDRIPKHYDKGLEVLVKQGDNYEDRRNRFLDYLLAVHGESFIQYSLSQFNYYYEDEEFEKELIKNKTRLLKSLAFINKERAKAFDYSKDAFGTSNVPGIVEKLSALLGLYEGGKDEESEIGYRFRSLTTSFKDFGVELIDEKLWKRKKRLWEKWTSLENIEEADLEAQSEYIDEVDYDLGALSEEKQKELIDRTVFVNSKILSPYFLREGLLKDNYRVYWDEGSKKHFLVYKSEELWEKVGEFDSFDDAAECALLLSEKIRQLNIQSEGLHFVEHILLRPKVKDQKFGIYLCDEEGIPFLRSEEQFTYERRLEIIELLKDEITIYGNYAVEITENKDFEVRFQTSKENILFISLKANDSVEYTHEQMENLYKHLANVERLVAYEDKIDYYIRHSSKDMIVPEHFFAFRISIILPNWSARFENKEFRSIAEETMKDQIPAYISPSFLWLSVNEIEEFEQLYFEWLNLKKNNKPEDEDKLDQLNNEITQMLMTFASNKD